MAHPTFDVLIISWELTLPADGYAADTVKAYQNAVRSLAGWLAAHHPDVGPVELDREHVRGWLVHLRQTRSSSPARGWFAGVRHFCRWLHSEGETDRDATAGIRTPAPGDPATPVLSDEELRRLLAACAGRDFTARRDNAIIMLFLDGGLRLSELAGLQVADVDLRDRIVYDWAFLRLDDGDPAPGGQAGQRWLLVRRNRKTGELAFYYCWTPRLVPLAALVRVAGRRWGSRSASRPARAWSVWISIRFVAGPQPSAGLVGLATPTASPRPHLPLPTTSQRTMKLTIMAGD